MRSSATVDAISKLMQGACCEHSCQQSKSASVAHVPWWLMLDSTSDFHMAVEQMLWLPFLPAEAWQQVAHCWEGSVLVFAGEGATAGQGLQLLRPWVVLTAALR